MWLRTCPLFVTKPFTSTIRRRAPMLTETTFPHSETSSAENIFRFLFFFCCCNPSETLNTQKKLPCWALSETFRTWICRTKKKENSFRRSAKHSRGKLWRTVDRSDIDLLCPSHVLSIRSRVSRESRPPCWRNCFMSSNDCVGQAGPKWPVKDDEKQFFYSLTAARLVLLGIFFSWQKPRSQAELMEI